MKREGEKWIVFMFLPPYFCLNLMPITSPVSVRPITQKEFGKIDYHVMRLAFDSQNALGRLCDEVIYHNDLAARIEAAGFGPVRKEARVCVSHRDFAKVYSLDLVVADSAIYELKTDSCFVPDHDAQLLNYLLLRDTSHGKLINFRPSQVQSRFVNTTLTLEERHRLTFHTDRWREDESASSLLRNTFVALLQDWGGFLELPLYLEALVHFLGGAEQVPLIRDGIALGNQHFHLLTPEVAFRLTAMPSMSSDYERQLQSLLNLTTLRRFQWINMAHHEVPL